jgi:hypothetical protein
MGFKDLAKGPTQAVEHRYYIHIFPKKIMYRKQKKLLINKCAAQQFNGRGGFAFFSFFKFFLANQRFIFVIFSSVAPHRGQPAAKCHPRWQPTRRLAVSCGLGRRRIRTRDCRTTVWHATIEPPRLLHRGGGFARGFDITSHHSNLI